MKKLILTAALSLLLLAGCMTADVTSAINNMQNETLAILEETKARAEETLKIDENLPNEISAGCKYDFCK